MVNSPKRTVDANGRVVDQHVDAAEPVLRFGDHRRDGRRLAKIGHQRNDGLGVPKESGALLRNRIG